MGHPADERERVVARDRDELRAERERFDAARGEFHATAAEARDRLRDAWAAVESQQKRAAEEWGEANRYFAEQTASLDARAADLSHREKTVGGQLAHAEAEAAGLREEAAALERRILNARATLAELEVRRDRARGELLHTTLPDVRTSSDDFSHRELLLSREKAAVEALRSVLARDFADLDDARRLAAEQLAQLTDARARWQRAERQTVLEMEELARALRHREHELDVRDQRLIRADARRRADAHALWRLRLRLEAWQTQLAALEARSQAERGEREADLERRLAVVARREAALAATFARWEQARAADHARLSAELSRWAVERVRAERAAAEFDRRARELAGELADHAARTLAAEQVVGGAVQDAGSDRAARRLRVLRMRWERVFRRKAREIEAARTEATAERAALETRHRELADRMTQLVAREAEENDRREAADLAALAHRHGATEATPPASPEVEALRAEVERLAAAVLEIELPEPPDPPESELPWGAETGEESSGVVPFNPGSQAA